MQQNELAIKLGKVIRERRLAKGLRLVDLSLLCGVAIATLSDLENGTRDTKLSSYQRVLDALGIGIEHLFFPENIKTNTSSDGYDLDFDH